MITKRLLSAFTALIITAIMFTGYQSEAQVSKVFATTINASNTSTGGVAITGALTTVNQNAIKDTDLNTPGRINSSSLTSALTNTGYVEVQYPAAITGTTTTYIKFNIESSAVLQNLVGGAVGNLLNGLIGGLLGAQGISVEAKSASGTSVFSTTNFNQPTARVVRDATGNYYLAIKPGVDYKYVRINNTVNGALAIGTVWMDVYGIYYETGSTNCASGNYTSYDGLTTGIATVNLQALPVLQNAIDGNLTTSSDISLGTVNVANTYVEQIVYFSGTSTATDKYNIKLGMASSLATINVLSTGVEILGYSGTSTTPVYDKYLNDSQFLSVNIGTAVGANQPFSIQIAPTVAIDRISIRLNGGINVNLLTNALQIYEVTKGSFAVSVTGATTYKVGQTATLGTSFTGCSSSSYTYSWTGPNGFTATSANPTIPTTTAGTYTYTVVVTNDFGIKETATITVQVFAPGTISAAQTVCTGDSPANLTLSGNTANVIRWEKSTDITFATGVTTIANTTTSLAGSSIGPLTTTTYVRAVTQATGYAIVNSDPVALTVKTTTWNGTTWNNGIPDIGTTAIISGNYSENVDLTACSLQVTGTSVVSFATGRLVTLEKFINVASGSTVTFENNAHLVQYRDDAVNTGNIITKRNSSNLFRLDYTIWSSPVLSSQTLQAFSPSTSPTRFYEYRFDTTANAESYYAVDASATTFGTATSYLIRMPNVDSTPGYNEGTTMLTYKGQFTGVPNNGVITKAFSTQGNRITSTGNPYPSPINVIDFFNTNTAVIDQASALYFWRKKNNNNASTYATLTKIAYVANNAVGGNPDDNLYGGQQWNDLFNTTAPSTWIINPAQGFLIQSKLGLTNPVITFNNTMRRGTHNDQFFRPSQQSDLSRVWLNLTGKEASSQIAIAYTSEATTGLDAGYDGRAFISDDAATLYTTAADTKLTIQARPAFNDIDVVPMGFSLKNAGQYTISVTRKDGVFANGQTIYIRDNDLGVIHNLSDEDYTFTSQAGEFTNRLDVIYTTTDALGTNNPVLNANTVIVYQQEDVINVKSDITDITAVTVYDIRGRKLYSNSNVNATQTSITGLQAQHQVLIVEVNTLKGKVSKKIVF